MGKNSKKKVKGNTDSSIFSSMEPDEIKKFLLAQAKNMITSITKANVNTLPPDVKIGLLEMVTIFMIDVRTFFGEDIVQNFTSECTSIVDTGINNWGTAQHNRRSYGGYSVFDNCTKKIGSKSITLDLEKL